MRRLAAARLPLAAVWVTRGGLHGDRREAESRRAMDLIGVPPQDLFFLRLPDGRVLDYMDDIVARLARLFRELKPASVFVPAYEGGHPDHDAVQLAAAAAIARNPHPHPVLHEFPLYNRAGAGLLKVGEFIPGTTAIERTPMKLADRLLKRKLVVLFASQRAILWPLTGIKGGPMMVHMKGEPYRRVPLDRDYTVRPHPGRLAYEYYAPGRFKEFIKAAARMARD